MQITISASTKFRPRAPCRRIDWLFDQSGAPAGGDVRRFVECVNRTYYRHCAEVYAQRIVSDIAQQYADLCAELNLRGRRDFVVVDIGGGTGFEYGQLRENSVGWDKYFFVEPDGQMIRRFKQEHQAPANVITLQGKLEDYSDQLRAYANKLIVLNSCLHHVIWVEDFLDEIRRVMRPGDHLILCHEPNNRYAWSPWMLANYLWRSITTDFLLRKAGIWKSSEERDRARRWRSINEDLLSEQAIRSPLKPLQIRRIIDYWVGTKGDWKALGVPRDFNEGFWTPDDLQELLGRDFERVYFKTYRHLGDPGGNRVTRLLNQTLQRAFPEAGSVFCLVLKRLDRCGVSRPAA